MAVNKATPNFQANKQQNQYSKQPEMLTQSSTEKHVSLFSWIKKNYIRFYYTKLTEQQQSHSEVRPTLPHRMWLTLPWDG